MIEKSEAGGVRTITLCRPEKRNALNSEMLTGLAEAFGGAPSKTERVTVIRSMGEVFCAGRDLREPRAQWEPIEPVFHAVETWPLPVVSVVQGPAIAGGCELALHSDFVVASTHSAFGMSLAQIGLAPSWFLAKKLLEVAGPVGAREILMLGDPIPSLRMAELGLISRVAEPEQLESEVSALISRLALNAPLSLRAIKALLVREMAFRDKIPHDDVDALVSLAGKSADAVEGMLARMEKRDPVWKGE